MRLEEQILYGAAFVITLICAVFDSKKKTIPLAVVIFGGIAGIGSYLWQIKTTGISFGSAFVEIGTAFLPGIFLLLLSFFSGEKVGYGDGLLLLALGSFLGFYRCFLVLCISLILLSLCALVLLCMRKVNKNSRLPFVPFLAVGMGVGFFVC